jgi:hypothetical protein
MGQVLVSYVVISILLGVFESTMPYAGYNMPMY